MKGEWRTRPLSIRPAVYTLACVGLVAVPGVVRSQGMDCKQLKPFAIARGVDSVYPAAQALADELQRHGFTVGCMVRSHSESMFDGQAGAAMYQTDQGNFDALFMPPPETFDSLVIVERREGTRYGYSFEGQPKPWPANRIDSAQRMYFVKDGHRLFIVGGDERLAERLRRALTKRQ